MRQAARGEASAKGGRDPARWRERAGRLHEELRAPAMRMLRRAFGRSFGDAELEDIYASAWLGTLRALDRRASSLSDEEIRKYLLTAVAHQASKELRRRRRRPTAPLDEAPQVADTGASPEDRVASLDESRLTRELLASLPRRRRAVMLLRYGWGLDPSQVCELVSGLSPRAYRKEISRGVDELTEKLRMVERGDWCADREPLLKAYAAGLADEDQRRQARHHLSNCRDCAEFVGRLTGHLHDIGGAVAAPLAAQALDGRLSLHERALAALGRLRESLPGPLGGDQGSGAAAGSTVAASGAARGAGAGSAGLFAKLAGLGAGGKLVAVCIAGGAAATACLAAGVVPTIDVGGASRPHRSRHEASRPRPGTDRLPRLQFVRPVDRLPAPGAASLPAPIDQAERPAPSAPPADETLPAAPIAPTTPPPEAEFGVAAAAQPAGGGGSSGSSGSSGGSPESSAVGSEFGP